MSGPSSGLKRLAALLGALDPHGPPTPREIAELIWLGQHLPETTTGGHGPESHGSAQLETAASPPGQDSDDTNSPAAAKGSAGSAENVRLFLPEAGPPDDERTGGQRAAPVRVTGAAALPRRRALTRSLRPLKRTVPSPTRTVVDEDATADAIARDGRWLPVLVPAKDRWLDVNLIIDAHGDCADLWSPLGHALYQVLQELGAFREVRSHQLCCRADGSPALAAGTLRHGRLQSAASCIDPTGRTLTLVLTDGVSPLWQTPGLLSALRRWAMTGPTAILQTMPDHLWDRTALAPEPGRLHNTLAGAPNSRLHFSPYGLGSRPMRREEIPLPVLGIEPEWLAPWARAVAGTGTFDGAAVVLRAKPLSAGAPAGDAAPHARQPVTFEEFMAETGPRVFRLAAYLAAAPLNLSVMRLVQAAMVPHSPPSDLAEIVFSGILHKMPGTHADTLHPSYDFAPGVRHRLLSTLRRDEADAVISVVSTYINKNIGDATTRFTAAALDPQGPLRLPSSLQHWAAVRTAVRRRQGRLPATEDVGDHSLPADALSDTRPVGAGTRAVPNPANPPVPEAPVTPYWELTFDADGDVDASERDRLLTGVTHHGVRDLLLFAHGWNNDRSGATDLYQRFFAPIPGLAPKAKIGYVGVIWPSMRFSDESIPGLSRPTKSTQGPALDKNTRQSMLEVFPGRATIVNQIARILDQQPDNELDEFGRLVRLLVGVVPGGPQPLFAADTLTEGVPQSEPVLFTEDTTTLCYEFAQALVSARPDSAPESFSLPNPWDGAKELLRQATYYAMKRRAGTIGQRGLGPVVGQLTAAVPQVRVHLVGHSFGGRLVSFALRGLPEGVHTVKSVTLLQGAFSQYAFAPRLPQDARAAGVLQGQQNRIDGPLVCCYSQFDQALSMLYPLASRTAADNYAVEGFPLEHTLGPAWGAMGHAGIQAVPGTPRLDLAGALRGPLPASGCVNIDAAAVVNRGDPPTGAHNDILHPEISRVVLAAGRIH